MINRGGQYWKWPATLDCYDCGGKGHFSNPDEFRCSECIGVGIVPIPWEALFKEGRKLSGRGLGWL